VFTDAAELRRPSVERCTNQRRGPADRAQLALPSLTVGDRNGQPQTGVLRLGYGTKYDTKSLGRHNPSKHPKRPAAFIQI